MTCVTEKHIGSADHTLSALVKKFPREALRAVV